MSELITLVDILQPQCTREYGSDPCTASISVTGDAKCYNTRATCQDPDNYVAANIVLRFAKAQESLEPYGYVIPSLRELSIAPLVVNLAGMSGSSSPFGQRETLSLSFDDHLHSDLLVDKYRHERPTGGAGTIITDPYHSGTFWGKWLARNPYHESLEVQVHQGIAGQTVSEMETRHYLIDRISGPADGRVSISAKDVFSNVESRKALAPRASRCELRIGFDKVHAGTIEIIPAELADTDYPTGEFRVAINDEIIGVERTEGSASLTIASRGSLGTEAEDHDGGDKVQLVLEYFSRSAQSIAADLLENYAGIDSSYVSLVDWDAEMATRPERLTAHIAEPTPVETLIGEMCEQFGFSMWPDVVEKEIKLAVLQPDDNPLPLVTDQDWVLERSYSSRRLTEQRVSQVWVYYGQRNPLESQNDPVNYRARRVFADLTAEAADQYGSPAVKEVFSRWIPALGGSIAASSGSRILSLFRDPPLRVSFDLHRTREGQLQVAGQFSMQTRDEQSVSGQMESRTFAPIQLARVGERIKATAQQISFYFGAPETRVIEIDADTSNYNMRTVYDLLFGIPKAGEVVTFRILSDVTVSSTDAAVPAMRTGDWPANVDLRLVLLAGATIIGKGGDGGGFDGSDGENGGTALRVESPLIIDSAGTIAGGGGGGGGANDDAGDLVAQAKGGGGAGIDNGLGHENGTDTQGGEGGYSQQTGPGVEPIVVIAEGGNGGDLGEPGQDGFIATSGLSGLGGSAGAALDGNSLVFFDNTGTIIGTQIDEEVVVFLPAAVAPTSLALEKELVLMSSGDYGTKLVFSFDIPDDERLVSFEAQYQLGRDGATWRPLYDAYLNRHEWNSAEIGDFRVRVRTVYIRGRVYSAWVSTSIVSLGTFDQIASIGINTPIDPLLYITLGGNKPTADIRIETGFVSAGGAVPDRFFLFYSAQDRALQMRILSDAGSKLYLDLTDGVVGLFNLEVDSGSTDKVLNYVNTAAVDIDLYQFWWASVRNEPGSPSRYFKVRQADETALRFAPSDVIPFVPVAGQLIDMAELEWSDSRLPEFKLLWVDGEVIRHNGIGYDGQYYIDVVNRGAEGTTQATQTGKVFDYYPAPGPLTNTVEIPASEFVEVDGVFQFAGEIPVNIPSDLEWASVSCCLARKATDGAGTQFIRSNIVPLTIAGPT